MRGAEADAQSGISLETGEPCIVMTALCKKGSASVPTVNEPSCTKMYEASSSRSLRSKIR